MPVIQYGAIFVRCLKGTLPIGHCAMQKKLGENLVGKKTEDSKWLCSKCNAELKAKVK